MKHLPLALLVALLPAPAFAQSITLERARRICPAEARQMAKIYSRAFGGDYVAYDIWKMLAQKCMDRAEQQRERERAAAAAPPFEPVPVYEVPQEGSGVVPVYAVPQTATPPAPAVMRAPTGKCYGVIKVGNTIRRLC